MKLFTAAVFAFATLFASAATNLIEFAPRGGVPNFFAKIQNTGEIRVAYFGGSITAADGWRPKTLKWFQQEFPRARFSEINAAIGGTGSDLGVFRLQHDVLDFQPDLVFVEFAVNDGGAAREQIHRAMEGIVRQTWRTFPECDICFVYTIAGNMLETQQAGKLPRSIEAMEELATHYNIPSINFGLEVARLEKEGKLVFKAPKPTNDVQRAALADKMIFSSDAVHPHADTGHELYRQAVAGAFEQMRSMPAKSVKRVLGAPVRTDNFENAKMFPLRREFLQGNWQQMDAATNNLAKSFSKRMPGVWRAGEAGDSLEFKFRGTAVSIYDLLGPDCGQLRVVLDGKDLGLKPRFDQYCTYHRLGSLWVGANLTNSVHVVKISVDTTPLDKAAILARGNEKITRPEKFVGHNWYAGALLIDGDLVP